MNGARVMVALEAKRLRAEVVGHLRAAGEQYRVTVRKGLRGVPAEAQRLMPQVIVLGMHFDGEPLDDHLCAEIRRRTPKGAPGILILAHDLPPGMECEAQEIGADACLHAESLTRDSVQANVRWLAGRLQQEALGTARVGAVLVSREDGWVQIGEETFSLTPDQTEILWRLVTRTGKTVAPGKLVDGYRHLDADRVAALVCRHICRLRRRLGEHGRMIKTVRGRGYRFEPTAA